ncbi:tRNA (N(6)-L-threonylcarbamoyladenosine(37)-C(2))-methylthiotransferase MtaB [Thermanaeromonas sp. C210]|uniref:tRNA (N(6)-L-threonylcarbamoyladenosine(37)-C(2))- methylthiotransferase MtaB n=1 Tax=Thermanaeromonas sp. C210 TaxID=2731925 RepID=UPI00155C9E7B|nr:tRNA (N(6)-L-threonylcarbamoyladenosine(37)-C(2))-methylthiotransferase MtaB [Thermanaeromonas sp. C210]GFN22520.1 tRNA (N(6)-L-threonylcarbamoyladenosine(37)-C(2))-methylthiotran sferase MtaB [Thermanaeromonas sp. C210]
MAAKRVALASLGCKVNQNELEALKGLFRSAGYQIVPFDAPADVYVVHTCTVTHLSDRKSRQMIRRAVRNNPEAVVAVTGCYAQVAPEEVLRIPGVDVIVGTRDRARLVELVEEARRTGKVVNAVREPEKGEAFEELPVTQVSRARAFLKIQEGCEEYCTYCIVPYARGPLRSRAPQRVVEEVQRLVDAGYQEVVLTGVHTGAYGRDLPGGVDLDYLLRQLLEVPGLGRLRLSSIDPLDFTPRLIRTLTEAEQICPHFHIPLQSGDDFILERMGRRYTAYQYLELLDRLREGRPRAAITTDIIVGFPGEQEEHFRRTLEVVQRAAFARLHAFPYSPRSGTPAAAMPDQVPAEVKKERMARLLHLGRRLEEEYARCFLGETLDVLVEEQLPGGEDLWEGHTGNYLTVFFAAPGDWTGRLVPVRLRDWQEGRIWGEACLTGHPLNSGW